ncbi:ATP-binding cassette subfamily F protein uup [Oikeobacillus pervagus]|uniref:ATP-binding cassette subfamily F protein uup n=1 Tax=Oikeobacillus pervagus TaxID=1325931 RepID=A0AAJ1T604_9BACI|nr:ABC-F family ATP-binding cassette domain-containing protein [Oikeobacillus pervagus]MDQ0215856.1 ATP-binding cassette subfamily F protein uup [Oikeobacillus pervagus]
MRTLSIENVTKTYGEKILFRQLSFSISEKERIGLIGINGTGKSSLLKILAGKDQADDGELIAPSDYRIAYLPQEPDLKEQLSVMDQVFSSEAPIIQLIKEYEKTLKKLEQSASEEWTERLFSLQKQMDTLDAWDASTEAKIILSKLGIQQYDQKIGELSGGQKKRVALAQVLIETPDLLILDEPTNHLDFETIQWLQDYLGKYKGAILLVTHDRYFLDGVTNRILELDSGNIYSYKGNYQAFIEAKAQREEQEVLAEEKRKNLYRRELAWIKRGAKARSTKQKARIERFQHLEDQLGKVPKRDQVQMGLKGSRLGKQVLELKSATKSFEGKMILQDFDLLIKPGDRIGIVGKNGSGKSTLLNILAGKISLDEGELLQGQTVKIAYYTQERVDMDENKRMIAYIREAAEVVTTNEGEQISVAQMLERFLFPMHSHGTLIKKLSGGEKRRLYLLKLLMTAPNVLLLDEPTNDLDTETLTVLEDYLDEFPGVVITVSHDRYFLDKTSEQLLVFKGEGEIDFYYGSYSDYLKKLAQIERESEPKQEKRIEQVKPQEQKKKMTYMEKKEWEEIEDKITDTEEEVQKLEQELEQCGSDFEKAQKLMEEIETLNAKLEHFIERWTYLSELA